jgi:hypothetical protein
MTSEKEIKTLKEYISFKKYLKKLAKNAEVGLIMFTDIRDYNTKELIAIRVQYSPVHNFLVTSEEALEMIENKELEHPSKTVVRQVFLNIKKVFDMIVKKLGIEYKIYKSESGASIYRIDKYKYSHVGSIDICSEGKEKVLEDMYKIKEHIVRCRNFIIKIHSIYESDIINLTNVENLMNEYINFGKFKSLESD